MVSWGRGNWSVRGSTDHDGNDILTESTDEAPPIVVSSTEVASTTNIFRRHKRGNPPCLDSSDDDSGLPVHICKMTVGDDTSNLVAVRKTKG